MAVAVAEERSCHEHFLWSFDRGIDVFEDPGPGGGLDKAPAAVCHVLVPGGGGRLRRPFVGLVSAGGQAADQPGGLAGTCIPILVTGGIHLDGLLDTVDAKSSYGDRKKKLAILADPHVGAFAIIGGSVYLLLYAACLIQLFTDGRAGRPGRPGRVRQVDGAIG